MDIRKAYINGIVQAYNDSDWAGWNDNEDESLELGSDLKNDWEDWESDDETLNWNK